jgi:hypothetical protein
LIDRSPRCAGRSHEWQRDAHTGAATCWIPGRPYVSVVKTLSCLFRGQLLLKGGHVDILHGRLGAGLVAPR